mmetsp:Transcript_59858/g.177408  ORF Transcript_59858/g.177408 Transcript_59858/m.177408 type:complete len:206 (+) Transcript_59858:1214-1831(+)
MLRLHAGDLVDEDVGLLVQRDVLADLSHDRVVGLVPLPSHLNIRKVVPRVAGPASVHQNSHELVRWRRRSIGPGHVIPDLEVKGVLHVLVEPSHAPIHVEREALELQDEDGGRRRESKTLRHDALLLAPAALDHIVFVEELRLGEMAESLGEVGHRLVTNVEAQVHVSVASEGGVPARLASHRRLQETVEEGGQLPILSFHDEAT